MNDSQPGEGSLESWRLRVISILVGVLFLFYAYRLFSLQVLDGDSYTISEESLHIPILQIQV